jgi:hypothetical protein
MGLNIVHLIHQSAELCYAAAMTGQVWLFNDIVPTARYIGLPEVSNDTGISSWILGKDFEGDGHSLFHCVIPEFALSNWVKPLTFRILGAKVEIQCELPLEHKCSLIVAVR